MLHISVLTKTALYIYCEMFNLKNEKIKISRSRFKNFCTYPIRLAVPVLFFSQFRFQEILQARFSVSVFLGMSNLTYLTAGPARRTNVWGGGGCEWIFSTKFFTKDVKCSQNLIFLLEKTENSSFFEGRASPHTRPARTGAAVGQHLYFHPQIINLLNRYDSY